ncbi:hypothetical protein C8Q76DRAFT_694907 [Earliella scabrosa]|nr:hypothetical protein C8Q76DRAFT_694907 [Earliella scabrosa]
MDPPKDILPIFATYRAVYAYAPDHTDIDLVHVKWEYCSVLIPVLEGPIRGLVVRQDPCPKCCFPGKWIATNILKSGMMYYADPKHRVVSYILPNVTRRLQIKFCSEREFWWFMNEYSEGMLAPDSTPEKEDIAMRRLMRDVRTHYASYLRWGSSENANVELPAVHIAGIREVSCLPKHPELHPMPLDPRDNSLRIRLAASADEVGRRGELDLMGYLKYAGIEGMQDDRNLRKDLLSALGGRNALYRASTIKELRGQARAIREQDSGWSYSARQRIIKKMTNNLPICDIYKLHRRVLHLESDQNEVIAKLEGLFINSETNPAYLRLKERDMSLDEIFQTFQAYKKVRVGFELLEQLQDICSSLQQLFLSAPAPDPPPRRCSLRAISYPSSAPMSRPAMEDRNPSPTTAQSASEVEQAVAMDDDDGDALMDVDVDMRRSDVMDVVEQQDDPQRSLFEEPWSVSVWKVMRWHLVPPLGTHNAEVRKQVGGGGENVVFAELRAVFAVGSLGWQDVREVFD